MPFTPRVQAVFLLIVLSIIWGTSFILIKQGLKVFAPDEVGALRVTAAALFLLPAAMANLKGLDRKHYLKLFASGLMGVFIPSFLFAFAQTRMNSSVAGIMNALTPLFTMAVGAWIYGVKFKKQAIVGIMLGLAGTLLLMISRSGTGVITGINVFALLIVTACFSYAMNLNFIKFKIQELSAIQITSVSLLLIGPLAVFYLFVFTDFQHRLSAGNNAWQAFGFVVLLGIMSTSIAMFLFNRMVKISTPLFASSVTYIIPLVAVFWGVLDNEKLYPGHYIGMATILAGVYLSNRKSTIKEKG